MHIQEIIESTEYPEKPIYYFAYGMLTDPDFMGDSTLVGVGTLPNFKFEMFQHANVVPAAGSKTYGSLWEINRKLLSTLDMTEGYPYYYDRKNVPVYCNGKKFEAEVYTMTPESRESSQGTSPKKSYLKRIMTGYHHAGIPLQQLKDSLR